MSKEIEELKKELKEARTLQSTYKVGIFAIGTMLTTTLVICTSMLSDKHDLLQVERAKNEKQKQYSKPVENHWNEFKVNGKDTTIIPHTDTVAWIVPDSVFRFTNALKAE